MDFLNQHSPVALVPKIKNPVPFLLIAGERDSLTESKMSKAMKAAFDKGTYYTTWAWMACRIGIDRFNVF